MPQESERFVVSATAAAVAFVSGSTTVLGYNLSAYPEQEVAAHGRAALVRAAVHHQPWLPAPQAPGLTAAG